MTIKSDRYQAQTGSWARDITDGSRVTVTGRLWVIADYEWDAFPIDESRADWLVKAVARAGDGDAMIDLDLSEAATGG